MAQTGYTPISLYYSTTTTNVPSAGNLVDGELAINTADGKLFYKDNLGAVQVIASKASTTNVSSFQTSLSGLTPSTATTGAVTLAGTLGVTSGGTGTATAFTTGSVVFAGASGVYSQDNANLFWDDTNNRLGIGTTSPAATLDVFGIANFGSTINTGNNVSTGQAAIELGGLRTGDGNSFIDFHSTSSTDFEARLIRSAATNGAFTISNTGTGAFTIRQSGAGVIAFDTSNTERMRIYASGGVSIGATADPGANNLVIAGNFQTNSSIVNSRIAPRSLAAASTSGTVTPDSDLYDQVNYLLTGTATFAVPSGTPSNGQKLSIRLYAASTQTVSWTTTAGGYRIIGTTLPLSVAAGKTIYVGCVYNSTDAFWDVVAVATEA
jgi:hypothetical protein